MSNARVGMLIFPNVFFSDIFAGLGGGKIKIKGVRFNVITIMRGWAVLNFQIKSIT